MKLTLLLLLLTFTSQYIFTQKINEYSTFSKHFDNITYLNANNRAIASDGIITEKNQYHPLNIAFYGIMAYEEYRKKKDSTNFQRMQNQYKYFTDTSKIHLFNNKKEMGLPYLFPFHDLKAPWYSGMTQGAGISFVLRYYDATKDTNALTIAKQLAAFLLKDISKGGTIGKTPEGFLTIEEYPGSKNSPQVLNGFITGLVGLYEYLQFFPEDTVARKIHDNCYEGMFASLEHYDTPTWTNYHRKNRAISNMYIRFQLAEFEHLYELYKDPRLIHQMMIWGMMSHDKADKSLPFYHHPTFQYSLPMKDSLLNGEVVYFPEHKPKVIKTITLNNTSTDSLQWNKKSPLIIQSNNYFNKIRLEYDKPLNSKKLFIEGAKKNKYTISTEKNTATILLSDSIVNELKINYNVSEKKSVKLKSPTAYHSTIYDSPMFAFVILPSMYQYSKEKNYRIYYETENTPNMVIFYRTAINVGSIANAKWIHYNQVRSNLFTEKNDGVVQFMISYSLNEKSSSIHNLKFELEK